MDKQKISRLFNSFKSGVSKHSPEILMGIGLGGMFTTAVLVGTATPKAMKQIEEATDEKGEDLTPVEIVKAAWKPYVPAAITFALSTGCIIGGNRVSAKRNALIATAYQISTTALNEYQDKVVDIVGEEKAKEIRDKVAEDKTKKAEFEPTRVIVAGSGDVLIWEPLSNRYFRSTVNRVEKAMNEMNGRMIDGMEMYVSHNTFLNELKLPNWIMGDDIGWSVNKRIDLMFEPKISDDGEPCLAIAYLQPPFHQYDDLY